MEPIGYLESCYKDKFGTPRQPLLVENSWARLTLNPQVQPADALEGIEGFSHLWLIFLFHQNTNLRYHAKVHPPRLGGKSIGVFSTRSPHRPNPIGLSLVRLEKREGHSLILRGADLIEGTPVLDIKPYLPEIESVSDAKSGWTSDSETANYPVVFTPELESLVKNWAQRIGQPQLKEVICKTLSLDPRPLVYRGDGADKYRDSHAVRLFDGDVHFHINEESQIIISQILF